MGRQPLWVVQRSGGQVWLKPSGRREKTAAEEAHENGKILGRIQLSKHPVGASPTLEASCWGESNSRSTVEERRLSAASSREQ